MIADTLTAVPLNGLVKLAGTVFTAGVSIYILVVRKPPVIIAAHALFSQTRGLVAVVIGVFLSLTWGLLGNQSATAALAIIAGVSTSLGFVAFFWVAWLVANAPTQKSKRNGTLLLFAYVVYSILISWGLGSATVFLSVLILNKDNPASISISKRTIYQASLTVVGTANIISNRDADFQVSSGQVTFGCEETKVLKVEFPLPGNSIFVGAPIPRWDNFSNSSNPQATASLDSGRAIASGTIRGLNYEIFPLGIRNCPGGGHGELVLAGKYRTTSSRSEPRQIKIMSTLSSSAVGPVKITLPTESELLISAIRIDLEKVSSSGQRNETIQLTPQLRSQTTPDGKVKATLDLQQRELILELNDKGWRTSS